MTRCLSWWTKGKQYISLTVACLPTQHLKVSKVSYSQTRLTRIAQRNYQVSGKVVVVTASGFKFKAHTLEGRVASMSDPDRINNELTGSSQFNHSKCRVL